MLEKIQTDSFPTTRDEATELCIHHLRLAALFFEAGAVNSSYFLEEARRQCRTTNGTPNYTPPWLYAAEAFINRINKSYEEMKKYD